MAPSRQNAAADRKGATGQPRWLDADEQRAWRAFLVATKLLFEEFERDMQKASMPLAYYEILVRLSEAPGRSLRMSELAANSQASRSRLTHAADRLEQDGLIRRESVPTDKRGTVAVLTDKGFALLEKTAPLHVESVRAHLFDQLELHQVEQLRAISEALVTHLRSLGRSCPTEVPSTCDAHVPDAEPPPGTARS